MTLTLSLVIPAYNEAKRIESSLKKLVKFADENDFVKEVIIVVEKSSDQTLTMVQAATHQNAKLKCIANPEHRGKGFAVRTGMLSATADFVLFCDADLGVSLDQIPKAFESMIQSGADVLIGNRFSKQGPKSNYENRSRAFLGWVYRNTVLKWLGLGVDDSQCGFKMFSLKIAKVLFHDLQTYGFAFDVELLLSAQKKKFKIIQYPVKWVNLPGSSLSIIRHGMGFCFQLLRIKTGKNI